MDFILLSPLLSFVTFLIGTGMSLHPRKEALNYRRSSRLNFLTSLILLAILGGSLLLAWIYGRTDPFSSAFLWLGFLFTFPVSVFFSLLFSLYSKKYSYREEAETE